MHRNVVVTENFYENPDLIVRYARTLKYCAPYNSPDDILNKRPLVWRTSWFQQADACRFKSSSSLIAKLEVLTGERIDLDHWCRGFPLGNDGLPKPGYDARPRTAWWNACFHVKHHAEAPGEGVHNHTELDPWNSVGAMGWVGVVFLTKDAPFDAGISIWRNRHGDRNARLTPKEDWELLDLIGNVYNRLVLHRGYIPHSCSAGWGRTVNDGFIFQSFFFSTLTSDETQSISQQDLPLPYEFYTRDAGRKGDGAPDRAVPDGSRD